MKLTWFGGKTLRVYIGGKIVVVRDGSTPDGVDRGEVVAGADRVIELGEDLPRIDAASWRPIRQQTALERDISPGVEVYRIAESDLLLAAAGEPPLVLLAGAAPPPFGRWVDGAVVVLLSGAETLVSTATVLLDVARPKLIALAADEQTLDTVVAEIAEHLDGAGLVSLEVGLALEV